ncbi:hypothetical protein [Nonomuraea sp. NPDC049607]|uniref:hypothetical protein n=1 Tax=Nonomuraea sp. NPDC049607 TaxID=3154732 RepID=UPI003431EDA9
MSMLCDHQALRLGAQVLLRGDLGAETVELGQLIHDECCGVGPAQFRPDLRASPVDGRADRSDADAERLGGALPRGTILRETVSMPGSARHRRPPDHPAVPVQDPAGILDEQERWDQFQRCLADSALPLDVRAAGALLLLFGMPISRIRRLRAEHLRDQDDGPT